MIKFNGIDENNFNQEFNTTINGTMSDEVISEHLHDYDKHIYAVSSDEKYVTGEILDQYTKSEAVEKLDMYEVKFNNGSVKYLAIHK